MWDLEYSREKFFCREVQTLWVEFIDDSALSDALTATWYLL